MNSHVGESEPSGSVTECSRLLPSLGPSGTAALQDSATRLADLNPTQDSPNLFVIPETDVEMSHSAS